MTIKNLIDFNLLNSETISDFEAKVYVVDEVYNILKKSYQDVKGGLNFENKDDLISSTSLWKIIYCGDEIVGTIIYKSKKGLKMVALGIKNSTNRAVKKILSYLLKISFRNTWMEVSEAAERFILKIGGENFLVPNTKATKLTSKDILELCEDGYHYKRVINGIVKTKVIVGNPRF